MESSLRRHGYPKTPGQLILRSFRFAGHIWKYCRELGLRTGLQWYCSRFMGRFRLAREASIRPPTLLYPVAIGMKPISDEYVFDEIFVRHEYDLVSDLLENQKFILDLGANVGYASAFLASRYRDARIVAVEPDPRNFEACCRNLRPYGDRIRVLNGAVWSHCSQLALSHELGEGMATQVITPLGESDADVTAWDIPALLRLAGTETADLVKIDIEGSELELFTEGAGRWLPRVRNICIELHDDRRREVFFEALTGFDYELVEMGESTLCLNVRARVAEPTSLPHSHKI